MVCVNGGVCNRWSNSCDCEDGFEGEFCEITITEPAITTTVLVTTEDLITTVQTEVNLVENCEYFGDTFDIGAELKIHCKPGYELDGPDEIECTQRGWIPELDTGLFFEFNFWSFLHIFLFFKKQTWLAARVSVDF